ncbi:MAG: RluA family pseudouridine synthase [Planctomycetota bacterium]
MTARPDQNDAGQPRLLFDDGSVLALYKPSGLPTVPYRQGERQHCLRAWAEETLGHRVYVVHRLDRDTSGVLVFAKDARAHRALSLQFERRQTHKRYLAAVAGHVAEPSGEIDAPLREFGSGRVAVDARGKAAHTRYTRRERLDGADLLEVEILTGRRHQIRVHLYHLGHPVLGDPTYGDARPVGGARRLMLHAARLELAALDGDRLVLEVPPPPDFEAELARRRPASVG